METNRFRKMPVATSFGNAAVQPSTAILAAAAAGTVIQVFRLPPGAELYGIRVSHDALGAGVKVSVGIAYDEPEHGEDAAGHFAADIDVAAKGGSVVPMHPVSFDYPVTITATITGAAATGKLTITPEYQYLGTR